MPEPSMSPSVSPSESPSISPSISPSVSPSASPSFYPMPEFDLKIPAIQVSGTITGPRRNKIALIIPVIQISGNIVSGSVVTGSISIPAIQVTGVISRNAVVGAIGIPALKIAGKIVSGNVISSVLNIPAITISGTIAHFSVLTGTLEIPAIVLQGQMTQIQVATVAGAPARRGFVMNLSHFGVTEYSNFSFNSFCDYHQTGLYLGASEDGISLLEGDDDDGVYISAYIWTGTEDLWTQFVKRLREGFAQKRGGPLAVDLILDEGKLTPITREMDSVTDEMSEERVKFPKGLKNRYTSFIIRNLGGADFSLESFRVLLDDIQRKVR